MSKRSHNDGSALARTKQSQASAADPTVSVWVNANAGTGKTHVLTQRVLRLLLAGTPPEKILCLTYTKAAAAEMSTRVFNVLGTWVTAPDAELHAKLHDVLSRGPAEAELALARTLFTRAIETPGGLKIQTIHAFAERLLQRFPLEAGVAPGFRILDDTKGRELIARAITMTLEEATGKPGSALGAALGTVVRYAADARFDELISKAVAERALFAELSRMGLGREDDEVFAEAERTLRRAFGLRDGVTANAIDAALDAILPHGELVALRRHLETGGKNDQTYATLLGDALAQNDRDERLERLSRYFLTKDGEPRGKLLSVALSRTRPDLEQMVMTAQQRFIGHYADRRALAVVEASIALYRLTARVLQRYSDAKRAAGALDFDDLITRTRNLLRDSGSADWVLFKLDGGLDHVLVDEAQDTSPHQWQIVTALANEFFSGSGARETAAVRTVFAVGDEKQSIYSFQGAAPEQFQATGEAFRTMVGDSRLPWRDVSLNLSFRTVQSVLDAVDSVFSDAGRTPGVATAHAAVRHFAERQGHAGLVEIWPTEVPDDRGEADPFDPLSDTSEQAPANRLAERIAETIKGWLDSGELLASAGRAIRAGDILILVRKRNPFAVPMIAALKKRDIAVAGSDRIALADQIAVQDLVALGDFVTLPEDDLQLATVLKGPLFNLDDDDLLTLAGGRKGSLWKALLAHARDNPKFAPAADALKRWRSKADFLPPYEFFASLLDRDGGREKLLNRLGPEAADAIDEFLDLAIGYDDTAPPSLTGFLAYLRTAKHEVKRDMEHGRNEVRVMTVHGAKGLEAPIVFLPDTCTADSSNNSGPQLLALDGAARPVDFEGDPLVWTIKGARHDTIMAAREAKRTRERAELDRLLYVAMTRARDRLYVAGFDGKRARPDVCWYNLIFGALEPQATVVTTPRGDVWRISSPQTAAPKEKETATTDAIAFEPLPLFATQRIAAEPRLSIPLQPSRLEPYGPDDEGEPLMPARRAVGATDDVPSPIARDGEYRFLRGTLTHALLQHLPGIARDKRAGVARTFLEKRGAGLSASTRRSIADETLAVLDDPTFGIIFSENSRAEVPISAVLPRPSGMKGPSLDLSGQIDRLAVTADAVLIVDYKTNRPPPLHVSGVAAAYLFQLAAYALALSEIYPGRAIKAALLWTDGPRLMEIPDTTLTDYKKRLWELDVSQP